MSIQIVSCAPYAWYRSFSMRAYKRPGLFVAWQFVRAVRRETGIRLPLFGTDYFEDDLGASTLTALHDDLVKAHCSKKTVDAMGASVYLPSSCALRDDVRLPYSWYFKENELKLVRSTREFREALDEVNLLTERLNVTNETLLYTLDIYADAITFSERHLCPIYFSF